MNGGGKYKKRDLKVFIKKKSIKVFVLKNIDK